MPLVVLGPWRPRQSEAVACRCRSRRRARLVTARASVNGPPAHRAPRRESFARLAYSLRTSSTRLRLPQVSPGRAASASTRCSSSPGSCSASACSTSGARSRCSRIPGCRPRPMVCDAAGDTRPSVGGGPLAGAALSTEQASRLDHADGRDARGHRKVFLRSLTKLVHARGRYSQPVRAPWRTTQIHTAGGARTRMASLVRSAVASPQ